MYTSCPKPDRPVTGAAALPISGVQRLNADLASVFDRIEASNRRVASLASQFGTPEHPTEEPLQASVVTTNDHMVNISSALVRLEQTISRIDNQ